MPISFVVDAATCLLIRAFIDQDAEYFGAVSVVATIDISHSTAVLLETVKIFCEFSEELPLLVKYTEEFPIVIPDNETTPESPDPLDPPDVDVTP
jgi:hypothetical protein